ncbi:MAG: hypothetical protein JOZ55_00820 [Alphaproteobacteria bacterium]|nr:hypothetical protein [Alphaproteobacteria bacterium]
MEPPKSLTILAEACDRHGVSFALVDRFSGFVAAIGKGSRQYFVGAAGIGIYPINRAAPFGIARDKAFTHYVLDRAGFRSPRGEHFFLLPPGAWRRPPGREREDALTFALRLSDGFATGLVTKPNSGKGARLVQFVSNLDEFDLALDAIAGTDEIALVQEFVDQPEFRLFLIDGEIAFAYRKSRKTLEGDGTRSIRRLLADAANALPTSSSYLERTLAVRELSFDSILATGQQLPVDFIANIASGGSLAGFLEPDDALRAWARRLARAVSLRVTGIDIFSASALAEVDDILVTDVNGSPNLGTLYDAGHRELVLDTWGHILQKTFDTDWPEGF